MKALKHEETGEIILLVHGERQRGYIEIEVELREVGREERLIKRVEERLKPKYQNDVFTWHQIKNAIKVELK